MLTYDRRSKATRSLTFVPYHLNDIVMIKRNSALTLWHFLLVMLTVTILGTMAPPTQASENFFQPKFSNCRSHFAGGEPPRMDLSKLPGRLRELCFKPLLFCMLVRAKHPFGLPNESIQTILQGLLRFSVQGAFIPKLAYLLQTAQNSRTTKDQDGIVVIWRLQVICQAKQPWHKVFRLLTWCLKPQS